MSVGAATRWIYDFTDGARDMRALLGGKGANVAEMTQLLGADLVPAGFTITTEACVAYMAAGQAFPEGLDAQVTAAVERLEQRVCKRLGDPRDPLLVSVRSGAHESMPGMLDTVINLGLNEESWIRSPARHSTTIRPRSRRPWTPSPVRRITVTISSIVGGSAG